MRNPLFPAIPGPSLVQIQSHADKINECAWTFQHAIECLILPDCHSFDALCGEVSRLTGEADVLVQDLYQSGRGWRGGSFLNSRVYAYLRAQDDVLSAVERALSWAGLMDVSKELEMAQKEFLLLIEAVVDPVEEMAQMVVVAGDYLRKPRKRHLESVKESILNIRKKWRETEKAEVMVKRKMFQSVTDAVRLFHLVRFSEYIGLIAFSAHQAGACMWSLML